MTDERIKELQERIAAGESKVQIAKDMRISRDTLYRYLKEGKVA
jgi:DNA invertase Pin-like site-specific DNA recombinase